MTESPSSAFWKGVRAELPIIIGVLPFGLIFGVLAVSNGIPPLVAFAMSSIVFAGSAQFLSIELIATATPMLIIWLTTFVINARHFLYSASLAPRVQHLRTPMKTFLAYLLTDEAYVPTALRYENEEIDHTQTHYYWIGAGFTLWISWQISTALGILVGEQIPASWGLDFTLPLTFIGMIAPTFRHKPMVLAALTAGVVAVAASGLPYQLGLIVAAVAGITVGMFLEHYLGGNR